MSLNLMKLINCKLDTAYLTYISFYLNFVLCGYPRYTRREFQTEVYGPKNNDKELNYLAQFDMHITIILVCCVTISASSLLANLIFPIYTIASVIELHNEYSTVNISELLEAGSVIKFGCLATNCSRMSKENAIIDDLTFLPIFKLCFPSLQPLFFPVLDTNLIGLILHAIVYYLILIYGIWLPIDLYINPLHHEAGLFVFVPETIRRYHGELARNYLIDRSTSMKCYYYGWRDNLLQTRSRGFKSQLFQPRKQTYSINQTLIYKHPEEEDKYLKAENAQLQKLSKDYSLLSKSVKNYIDDCMPLIRTEQYRLLMVGHYWFLLVVGILYVGTIWITCVLIANHTIVNKQREFVQFDQYIRAAGCALWRSSEGSQSNIVKLNESKAEWTILVIIKGLTIFTPISIATANVVAVGILFLQELIVEIAAQSDRLQLVIELTQTICQTDLTRQSSAGYDFKPYQNSGEAIGKIIDHNFKFEQLRSLHNRQMKNLFGFAYLIPIKDHKQEFRNGEQLYLNGCSYLRALAGIQMIDHGCNIDVYLNALIKIYVSIRGLSHLISKTSKNMTRVLSYCCITLLGTDLLVVYYNRKFNGRYNTSIWFTVVALTVTNLFIAAASKVQASSKHLLNQIWILIADMSEFKDPRVRHMRYLWIKQAIALGEEGGMTMKAYNIPLTYETMIELIIWSSTLTILAFSR